MGATNVALLAFNRGRISPLALARTDFDRTAMSAEVMTNWLPRSLGAMTLRPGLEYTGATKSNAQSLSIPFVYALDDTARIELTANLMRVWVDDVLVTRPSVTAAVTNGAFDSNLTGWTDADGAGATSAWATGGYMSLIGSGTAAAKRTQQVTVNEAGTVHALAIVVNRGPVLIRVGSTSGGDEYVTETTLSTGYHNLAFTPSGNFHITLFNYNEYAALVDSVTVASSGTMELTAPWGLSDLSSVRWDQSGDVLFLACPGYRQRRIERRSNSSWSIVEYQSDNGPFRVENTGPITIAPGATSGDTTLTASEPLFRSGHVGALFRLEQTGQSVDVTLTGEDQWSSSIRVAGVDAQRAFAVIITGTFTATVTLQYSVGAPGDWIDAASGTYVAPTSVSFDDTLDNQIIYYRIGIKPGNYTSGTADATLSYSNGSQTGIARVTGYTSSTSVNVQVLSDFGNATASSTWWESYWSGYRGYPSSAALFEGRMWWAGKDRQWGSVTDDFANFDDTIEGDRAPISRSIGSGPVDTIHWLMPLQRLILGAEGEIRAARSSSLDEPLTVSNFNLKSISTDGAKAIAAVKLDASAIYVSGRRFFELGYDGASFDYVADEVSQIVPEIGDPGVVKIAAQQKPEKRLHAIRSDGTAAVMIYLKQEKVLCWVDYETDGVIEDVCILPGEEEDSVYYTVRRTINGSTVRYHEKFAMESECRGFPEAKLGDSFHEWSGSASTTITGLSHLEGETVCCWGWNTATPFTNADGDEIGRYFGTFTVASGQITGLSTAVTNAVVGLPYTARYKSSKLAYAVEVGTALTMKKKVSQIGIIARWIHAAGLRYGPSFDYMDELPGVEDATDVSSNDMRSAYDEEMFGFPGEWSTDSRICLEATAPKPATVLAAIVGMEAHPK